MFVMGHDEASVTYLLPVAEALNYMASRWWANLIQKCHEENQKGNRNYGAQFCSSIAAAYEIHLWELNHKKSVLFKACFFRTLALALSGKTNDDTMAALRTKFAFSLLVRATFMSKKRFALEALQLARKAILLNPTTAGTKMLLARILLWSVCDSDTSDDALSDLEVAIRYIEESMAESPNEFSHVYGADGYLQRAFEARYIVRGEADDMQKAMSLERVDEMENPEEMANAYSRRMSIGRKRYVVDNCALDEVLRDKEMEASDNATLFESQSQGLPKIYHLMIPGLAREAMEAGLLACQSPVEVEDNRKQPASNFLIGINYIARGEAGKGRQFDLENAIPYLEAAQGEEPADTERHLLSSIFLADTRWKLGRARKEITLLQAGMESMALLLDNLTANASPPRSTLIDMMERFYFFWKASKRVGMLSNAARFVSYLLREDNMADMLPNNLSAILCKGGEIAAEIRTIQPDQTLVQDPLYYWTRCWRDRRAALNARLHAMHLASKHLFRQKRYKDAFQYAKKAVELVRFACPSHLEISERERLVPLLNGISVDACALGIKLGRDKEALEVLEQGRGILNFLPDAFADSLNELRCQHPRLFVKFERCRQCILATIDSRDPAEQKDGGTRSPEGNNDGDDIDQMASVLAEIRRKPKFKNFYRPITAAEMQSLATVGPIIVLVGSSLLPYAVIVRQHSIETIDLSPEAVEPSPFWDVDSFHESSRKLDLILGRELARLDFSEDQQARLQTLTLSDRERAEDLRRLLYFLWHAVIGPINRVLKFDGPQTPNLFDSLMCSWKNRIAWIRTGSFRRIPVHVALNDRNVPFISYATSSFVASFQSLSLSHSSYKTAQRGLEDGLLITMPSKPSKSQRPAQVRSEPSVSVSHEMRSSSKDRPFLKAENVEEEVSSVIKHASNINWSVLERPSAEQVKDNFPNARFIHFICHGVEDRNEPRRSHLKLWKETRPGRGRVDPLFVSNISTWLARKTALVFLSACSVADAESVAFSDENLNISNAFAVAGVPDVVGSMWPVSSSIATQVASTFWKFLSDFFPDGQILDGDLVARALHLAICTTATSYPDDPLMWAGFIHVGGMGCRTLADVRGNPDDEEDWISTDDESVPSGDEIWEEDSTSDSI